MRVTAISAGIAATAWLTTATVHADQRGHVTPSQSQAHASQTHGSQAPKTTGPSKHTTTTTTTPTSPIAQKIASHPQLAAKLQPLLPLGPDGKPMPLNAAALGYHNQGQFIAALHVSHNLGIPFASLKTEMVDNHMSLGQAIQKLKPSVNSTSEAERGETEADHDIKTGTTTSSTATSSSTAGKTSTKTGSHK